MWKTESALTVVHDLCQKVGHYLDLNLQLETMYLNTHIEKAIEMGGRREECKNKECRFREIVGSMDALRFDIFKLRMAYSLTERFDIIPEPGT